MIRKLLLILALFSGSVWAQTYTTTSGTITDSNGIVYANCSVNITLQNTTGQPPMLGTNPLPQSTFSTKCNSSGTFSIVLPSNAVITTGGTANQTKWLFNICAQDLVTCFSSAQSVSGSTTSLTTALSTASTAQPCAIYATKSVPSGYALTGNCATTSGGLPGGVSGDLQMNDGSGGFAAAHANDNGSLLTLTVPLTIGGTGHYVDMPEATPGSNPASGSERWYGDPTSHTFSCLTSTGTSCAPTSVTLRTWQWDYYGVWQAGVCGFNVNLPSANAPTFAAGTNYSCGLSIPLSNTSDTWFVKLRVPTGVSGNWTYSITARTATATGAITFVPYTLCVPDGANPDTGSFTTTGTSVVWTPVGANNNLTASGTFTVSCAAGSWLYVQTTISANTAGAVTTVNYNGISVQAAL